MCTQQLRKRPNDPTTKHHIMKESTEVINERSFLKPIIILFLFQLTCGIILPFIDTFLDLGDGIHPHIHRLYGTTTTNNTTNAVVIHSENTMCVPGAGFSGFWFSLGRLHALEQLRTSQSFSSSHTKNHHHLHYECFSSGCLGVVATIMNRTMDQVVDLAVETQSLWRQGKIGRFDVVEYFVDELLDLNSNDVLNDKDTLGNGTAFHDGDLLTKETLSRIHVITTAYSWDDAYGSSSARTGRTSLVKYASRTPFDRRELKEMLIQTTWM